MIDDTNKPAETPASATNAGAAAAKPATPSKPKRVARPATPKPVRKPAASAAKPAAAAAKKTIRRPAAAPKPIPTQKAVQVAKPAAMQKQKDAKPAKAKKVKLVRDSFTMPEPEYAVIALLKKRCLNAGVAAKKSEILRAAVAGLAQLSDASVVSAIRRLEVIKTGRPAKGAK